DLPGHGVRREVVEALERDVDAELAAAFLQLVLHRELDARLHALEHIVKVVRGHFDELAVLEPRKRLGGSGAQVGKDSHPERELFGLDGTARLHVIADVHARWSHALELLLRSFSCHGELQDAGICAAKAPRRKSWWKGPGPSSESLRFVRRFFL